MRAELFILLSAAFFFTLNECSKSKPEHEPAVVVGDLPAPNWAFLGVGGGKAYYAEPLPNANGKTWFEADTYCRSMGMKLAEVLTTEQNDVFQNTKDPSIISGQLGYWTAARDKMTQGQLLWSTSWSEPAHPFDVIMWRWDTYWPLTCGYLNWPAGEGGRAVIFLESCMSTKGVVCQLDVPT